MSEIALSNLETISKQNGSTYWSVEDIASFFGYTDLSGFKKVVSKAISFATGLMGDDVYKEFKPVFKNNNPVDYKISRFGVFLCTMFASERQPNVKELRIVLAAYANFVFQDIERLEERSKLTHGEKYMTAVASGQGLEHKDFGKFKDAGYRGMYNMSLNKLKEYKRVSTNSTLYDFMGITELAANTFRVTQTAEKIRNENIRGTSNLVKAAEGIGKQVREIVKQNTGVLPESLPIEEKITHIKTKIKKGKSINKIPKD